MEKLNREFEKLNNKVRFIIAVIEGQLVVNNRKKAILLQDLKSKGFQPFIKEKKSGEKNIEKGKKKDKAAEGPGEGEDGESADRSGYDYLLSMPLWNLTWEKVSEETSWLDLVDTITGHG